MLLVLADVDRVLFEGSLQVHARVFYAEVFLNRFFNIAFGGELNMHYSDIILNFLPLHQNSEVMVVGIDNNTEEENRQKTDQSDNGN